MNAKLLALTLLVGHVIAVGLISRVLWRQLKILRTRPDPELREGRRVLFILALAGLCGNFVPIGTDVLVMANVVHRQSPSPVGILYALSNVITLIIVTGAVQALYVVAEKLLRKSRN